MFIYADDGPQINIHKYNDLNEMNHTYGGSLRGYTSPSVNKLKLALNKKNSSFLRQLGFKLVKKGANHA